MLRSIVLLEIHGQHRHLEHKIPEYPIYIMSIFELDEIFLWPSSNTVALTQ